MNQFLEQVQVEEVYDDLIEWVTEDVDDDDLYVIIEDWFSLRLNYD